MKKFILYIIFVLLSITTLFAQQGKYQRKSISSVETVWIKPGALQDVKFDYEFFDIMVEHYIEVERFDYNVLPENLLTSFREQSKALTEITPNKIGKILENTVVKEIVSILNSPDVKKNRGLALKDETAWKTFAATKAKSIGLTVKELEALMNSAYIYLPYITSMKKKVKEKTISVNIDGGLLWYQVKVDKDGNASVKKVLGVKTKGIGSATIGAKSSRKFQFGKEVFETTEDQYAQYDAVLVWAKNLGVKTKEINAFKLQAQVVEVIGRKYSFPLGFLEGVHLDDGFNLMEFEEDKEGNEIAKSVGFVRVIKTGKNIEDPTNYTIAVQLLGGRQDIGGVVMEHPRLGIDLQIKAGYITGINVPKEDTYHYIEDAGDSLNILKEDLTDAAEANLTFAYNIAPIIGSSQTFLDFDIGIGLGLAEFNDDTKGTAYVFDVYLGFTKKLWFSRANLGISAAGGIDMFDLSGKWSDEKYKYSVSALGVKFGTDFEYLINPDLSFNFGANYKLGFAPFDVTLEYDDDEVFSISGSDDVEELYPDLNLGGLKFSAGINYSLGALPFNLFGFLDPLKKH
ncbi:MAG: hypothetical protein ISS28_06390 [Candidatus Cloacimonetes bacterium]|nr:hypothetical protein [Candidatus Cloacimonadota bacterium]MBL7086708.1 hypothetical protein [Candidatus Cloacimonadota bacterium]